MRAILFSVIFITLVFFFGGWIIYNGDIPKLSEEVWSKNSTENESFNIICDGTTFTPAKEFSSLSTGVPSTFVGGVDFIKKSGWYQGNYSISESRKGSLQVDGGILKVVRPALYERYGSMIISEQFTLDRKTGNFEQSVSLKDGRQFILIKAHCGKLIKPPY